MKKNRVNRERSNLMRACTMVTTAAMLACMTAAAQGQHCDTGNQCMTNGMCMSDGTCEGTPLTGGSCDLSDLLCMVNGHCVDGVCTGDPAPEGTHCANGCGTCQPIFPGVPFVTCMADPTQLGKACDANLGACFTAVCTQAGTTAFCAPQPKECPDIDNNPCTVDACNPATGMCEHSNASPCVPECETCDPATGCQPANIGAACSIGIQTECPVETSCQPLAGRGLCLPGTPSSTVPTPTDTPAPTETPSPVPTTPAPTVSPGICVGDCGGIGAVVINNIITLVNIVLGNAEPSACSQGIPSGVDVNVAVVVKAVNNALNGCEIG